MMSFCGLPVGTPKKDALPHRAREPPRGPVEQWSGRDMRSAALPLPSGSFARARLASQTWRLKQNKSTGLQRSPTPPPRPHTPAPPKFSVGNPHGTRKVNPLKNAHGGFNQLQI